MKKNSAAPKTYVLDTNILIQSPKAIFGFDDNEVVITSTTMQELDKLKNAPGETGFKAREAIRVISKLMESEADSKNSLLSGIKINHNGEKTGMFRVELNGSSESLLPKNYFLDKADNCIINATRYIMEQSSNAVFLITNDIAMRINATICGVKVQGYRNEQIENKDNIYTGRQTVALTDNEMNKLFRYINKNNPEVLEQYVLPNKVLTKNRFEINEYVVFSSPSAGHIVTRYLGIKDETTANFKLISKTPSPMKIQARNIGQKMALDALMSSSDEIPLVVLKGQAGTAKTFLTLAAGLDAVFDNRYDKVMITRTNTLSDADIGFLPGTLEEKMGPLVSPFMDNLESLLRSEKEEKEQVKIQIEDMFADGTIEICSVAYMRGRSLTNTYLIVDEAQNSTIGQILEIITRAGEGTKIVLCGDPEQIDNPKLDRLNNGLSYASEKMKGSSLCAQLTFTEEETVRSQLAAEGALRLTRR